MVAEWWAAWLGIELNDAKRELPRTGTRHLGFHIDLREKMIRVTQKHKQKIMGFFDRILKVIRTRGRILVTEIQRTLGLQIWISTVFRVARQFLTSICDILRNTGRRDYFYPRKYPHLVKRLVFDLKF